VLFVWYWQYTHISFQDCIWPSWKCITLLWNIALLYWIVQVMYIHYFQYDIICLWQLFSFKSFSNNSFFRIANVIKQTLEISKSQWRTDNPEKLATLGTQDRRKKNTTQKIKKMINTDSTENPGWTQAAAKGNQFLPLINHPPCYSYNVVRNTTRIDNEFLFIQKFSMADTPQQGRFNIWHMINIIIIWSHKASFDM